MFTINRVEVLQNYSSAEAALDRPFQPERGSAARSAVRSSALGAHRHSRDRSLPFGQDLSPAFFCAILLLLPLLAIPSLIAFGRSDFFLRHGASIWVQANDAIFDLRDRKCDVLVFGDSTAMTGVDPAVIEQDTGFRACNIAVTNAVLAVTDNLALDSYLAHNAQPRVLLVQLSPDDFQRENRAWHQTIYAEGLLELLRHGTPAQVRSVLLHHPREAVAFAGYTAGYASYYAIRRTWSHLTGAAMPEEFQDGRSVVRNGFFTPPAPSRTFCDPATEAADPDRREFPHDLVASTRQRYSGRAGMVLVNVAPIPACDENLTAFRSQLAGLTSNPLLALPIGLFNDGRHYTAAGARVVSHLVAQELNEAADQNPSIDDRRRDLSAVRVARLRR